MLVDPRHGALHAEGALADLAGHAPVPGSGQQGLRREGRHRRRWPRRTNGTGPFKLVEWRRGDSIIMERFDDYYGGSPDIPPVGTALRRPRDLQDDPGERLARRRAARRRSRHHQRPAGLRHQARSRPSRTPKVAEGERHAHLLHRAEHHQEALRRCAGAPGRQPRDRQEADHRPHAARHRDAAATA